MESINIYAIFAVQFWAMTFVTSWRIVQQTDKSRVNGWVAQLDRAIAF